MFSRQPNGLRYALSGVLVCLDRLDNQAGRDHAALTEATSSQKSCLKTRTLRSSSPTTPALACGASVAPTHFVGDRVHAVLGRTR